MHRTNFISLVCPFKPIHVPSLIVASVSYILDMYEKVLLVFLPLATSAKKKKILKTPMEMRFDFLDLVQYVRTHRSNPPLPLPPPILPPAVVSPEQGCPMTKPQRTNKQHTRRANSLAQREKTKTSTSQVQSLVQ